MLVYLVFIPKIHDMRNTTVIAVSLMLIFFLTGFLLAPQEKDYEKQWEQVLKYEKEGLPRSAINVVNNIYVQARSDGNDP